MRTLTVIPTPQHINPPRVAASRPWPRITRRAPVKQDPLRRVRRAAAELAPETVERIAQRVVQLLRHESQPLDDRPTASRDLMDAGQLAKHLGLTRAWVYEHAQDLGAIQVGNGPRPRLRFDPALAREALRAHRHRSGPASTPARPPGRPRRRPTATSVPLLPVHEPRTRGIFYRRCAL